MGEILKMKKIFLATFLFVNISILYSQEWQSDFDEALKIANIQNKNILLVFLLPEACDTCASLEKEVLHSEDFKAFARENYILTKVDFQNNTSSFLSSETKAKNLLIVEKYNKDGFFPLVVLLNKNEKVLGKIGLYNDESPSQYIALLQSLEKLQ